MEKIVLQGFLRRNSRGRSYLVFYNPNDPENRSPGIIRLRGKTNPPSGQEIIVTGRLLNDRELLIERIVPVHFLRRTKQDPPGSEAA